LNNFTTDNKIIAIDLRTGKRFTTNPKNVAQERDFNRIDSDTFAPDALEMAYAEFESKLAPTFVYERRARGDSGGRFAGCRRHSVKRRNEFALDLRRNV
jgi:Protein of unknown function (DUF4238)